MGRVQQLLGQTDDAGRVTDTGRAKESLIALGFLAPSIVVFSVFFFYPFEQLVLRGLYRNNNAGTNLRYEGPQQYVDVLTGDEFLQGLWHSVQYVIFTVPAGLILGTLLAVAAHRRLKGIKAFQFIFSSTIASSAAVSAIVFLVLINQEIGIYQGGVPGFGDQAILQNSSTALFGVSLSSIWQNLGLSFVIVLAGLQAIPEDVDEAATLDGYGPVRRFFRITLPLLSPVLMFLVVVLVIFALQAFAPIEFLTQGGPNGSTETLVFKIFERQAPNQVGEGAVMSVGLFLVTFVVTLGQFLLLDRRVHYGS
ncbi:sugar ABC transporter permease [Iamia sp. SCSIO 61187]|uniref:carbohydrate ABC transporter permease n=1 Tax=Iamia sp. SCSIO 61187 TaxID=2722752 RepID=UPI001C62D3BA|nr:sugar ABC transporter permease [Iamia sp. SCSIO 61187]QYG91594.1 sugar ABC transporter permease [Iamia sp. SCSIO 61187]